MVRPSRRPPSRWRITATPLVEKSLHTFQTFWWGARLSPYEMVCLKSFSDRGYGVDLYTFDTGLEVPNGVVVCDASPLIERGRFFTYQSGTGKGSPAAFANLFRYLLLAQKGGWWIDTDVICLSSQIPNVREFFAWQNATQINSAVLYFEPDHPAMRRCLARAEELGDAVQWGQTGPDLLTSVLADLGATGSARPASQCYPVPYQDALDFLRPSQAPLLRAQAKDALFLHLWNEVLRRNGVRKYCLPPRGSLLRELCDRHEVSDWTGEYDIESLARQLDLMAAQERLESELARVTAEANSLRSNLAQSTQRNDQLVTALTSELAQARAEIAAMQASRVWRSTAPIRAIATRLRTSRDSDAG